MCVGVRDRQRRATRVLRAAGFWQKQLFPVRGGDGRKVGLEMQRGGGVDEWYQSPGMWHEWGCVTPVWIRADLDSRPELFLYPLYTRQSFKVPPFAVASAPTGRGELHCGIAF